MVDNHVNRVKKSSGNLVHNIIYKTSFVSIRVGQILFLEITSTDVFRFGYSTLQDV